MASGGDKSARPSSRASKLGGVAEIVRVRALVVLLLPLLGVYLSSSALLALAYSTWSLLAANKANRKDKLDDFWVACWLVYNLVVTPIGLFTVFAALLLPFAFTTSGWFSIVHRALVTAFAVYCAWIVAFDDSVTTGGVSSAKLRRLFVWRHLARYFDMTVTTTNNNTNTTAAAAAAAATTTGGEGKDLCSIPGNRIFCFHPHGIVFWGVIAGFVSHHWNKVTFEGKPLVDWDLR